MRRNAMRRTCLLGLACAALGSGGSGAVVWADTLDDAWSQQVGADGSAAAAQVRISQLRDETADMIGQYKQLMAEADSIEKYNVQLASQVDSQADQLAQTQRQLDEIATTQRDVLPLMQEMVATLERFVELDAPFLPKERTERVANIQALMQRSDVSVSEKFRRILEAYQIEVEYGRTLDAYEGTIGDDDDARSVEFVRLGRVSLLYQTPDGRETGYWDADAREWKSDESLAPDVKNALKIAKKQGAPDLLVVPVRAPQEVE